MVERTIIIKGRIPSKKNSTIAMCRNGRVFHFPSNEYQKWNKEQVKELKKLNCFYENIKSVTIAFYFPDNRKVDISNKCESLMDTLVDAGIIKDDCWQEVGALHLISYGIDKENPRCEISISI